MIRLGTCPNHGSWKRDDAGEEMKCPGGHVKSGTEFVQSPCGQPDITAELATKDDAAQNTAER